MISQWSARRRGLIFLLSLLIIVVVLGTTGYLLFSQKPDCFNTKQDGDETGVDCGGSCQLLCRPEILPLVTLGDARLLKIAPDTYEVVIVAENPNTNASVIRAPYTFNIYSSGEKKPVKTISASTY